MQNYSHVFKFKKNLRMKIASFLMLTIAILWFQTFLFGSIVLGFGSILFFVHQKGIELDFGNNKYRTGYYIGGYGFGNWLELPEIKYISVFKTTLVSAVRGLSNTKISSKEKVILVNLIHGRNGRITIFKTQDREEAFSHAEFIAHKMNLKIYDATERPGCWYINSNTELSN